MKAKILIIAFGILFINCGKRNYYAVEVNNPAFKPNIAFQSFEDLSSPKFGHLVTNISWIQYSMEKPMNLKEYYC